MCEEVAKSDWSDTWPNFKNAHGTFSPTRDNSFTKCLTCPRWAYFYHYMLKSELTGTDLVNSEMRFEFVTLQFAAQKVEYSNLSHQIL